MADPCSFFSVLTASGAESNGEFWVNRESKNHLHPSLSLHPLYFANLCRFWWFPPLKYFSNIFPVLSSSISWVYLGWTLINSQLFPCGDFGILSFVPAWPTHAGYGQNHYFFEIPIFFLLRFFYPLNIIADQKKFEFFSSEHRAWLLIHSFCCIFPHWLWFRRYQQKLWDQIDWVSLSSTLAVTSSIVYFLCDSRQVHETLCGHVG